MTPATLSAAITSSEANHAALVSRAASLAGKPAEHDAWVLARAAHRITGNLRQLLETCPKGNTMSTTTKDTHRESHTHTRSINFEGHEPEAYTGYTHKGKQWIPSHAWAEWGHGKAIEQINVTGRILKKDGTPSQNRGGQRYVTPASRSWDTVYGTNAPEWLLELFADSPHTTEAAK